MNTNDDDQELLKRFVSEQDEMAFKLLVERYQQPLYQFIWRHVGNQDDALDLSQKVFLQVFSKAEQFRSESKFKTWLYQIAINLCKNHFRGKDRQRIADVELEELELESEQSTMNEVEKIQEQTHLFNAVKSLPDKQRTTLELRLYQEYTFAEIAEIMNCPVGTAKANYHHAIKSLKNTLRDQDYE
ncbi:MAG: RNA polymerase sigma factor [Gammaproteobacteria bacterium]|nr:RNA polymerase sigma factor [Gammaproteobacteria bacterium]MDH5778098.1 RNA polymerase sigma factor [Gammaproteobacteria bacterium]